VTYDAYLGDTGSIRPGNAVKVSGVKVGQVSSIRLTGDRVKVTFTADRRIRVGAQSLVSTKTDTILGQRFRGDYQNVFAAFDSTLRYRRWPEWIGSGPRRDGMGAPNDLVLGPDGRLCVTDTRSGIDPAKPGDGRPGWVWAVDTANRAKELMIDDGPVFVNGLAFTLDGQRLMVTATPAAQLWSFNKGPTGSRGFDTAHVVHTFDNGWPDDVAVNPRGDVWVGAHGNRSARRHHSDRPTSRHIGSSGGFPADQSVSELRSPRRAVCHRRSPAVGAGILLGDDGDPVLGPDRSRTRS
jgi:hypothetical protein